jgi:hypothetical protein
MNIKHLMICSVLGHQVVFVVVADNKRIELQVRDGLEFEYESVMVSVNLVIFTSRLLR